MNTPLDAAASFNRLVHALSQRTATPLEARDGLLVLKDGTDMIQLVVELAPGARGAMLVARVMPIPQQDPAGALALRLLRMNADRDALAGSVIAADGARRQVVLIRELALDRAPDELADEIEALLVLAETVRMDVKGDRVPGTRTALLLHAVGGGA